MIKETKKIQLPQPLQPNLLQPHRAERREPRRGGGGDRRAEAPAARRGGRAGRGRLRGGGGLGEGKPLVSRVFWGVFDGFLFVFMCLWCAFGVGK